MFDICKQYLYDIVTISGSNFTFTKQALSLKGSEYVAFMELTTEEDLENGVSEIELNLEEGGFDILLLKEDNKIKD